MTKHALKIAACIVAAATIISAQNEYLLTADANSGHDDCWIKRYLSGKNCWGIRGTGETLNGNMWWDSFPGPTGTYKCVLGAVLEPDGDSPYKFSIDGQEVSSGRFPYSTGSRNCNSSTYKVADLDLGTHQITQGTQIKYWAQSVYPCGSSHGQYSRFFQIKFISESQQVDATPPSIPLLLQFLHATTTSITISWLPSVDNESDVKEYKIYVNDSLSTTSVNTETTITGLQKDTEYSIQVSAVNTSNTESAKCDAHTAKTASEQGMDGFVQLDNPQGGEIFKVGSTITIKWTAVTTIVNDVDIEFSPDGGLTWPKLNTTSSVTIDDPQWGNFEWTIPDKIDGIDLVGNSNCLIRVRAYDETSEDKMDVSQAFTISDTDMAAHNQYCTGNVPHVQLDGNQAGTINARVTLTGTYRICITDARGARIAQFAGKGNASHIVANSVSAGMYLMQVTTPKSRWESRFIVR